MSPIRLLWWRSLMDLRPLVRFGGARFPRLGQLAVRARVAIHALVGNLHQLLIALYGLTIGALAGSVIWGSAAWLVMVGTAELLLQTVRVRGGSRTLLWLVGWREAWRVRRRWPSDWALVAAKTYRVQAEVGTSEEPSAPALLRPIGDHPKLSWWADVQWPRITWWVGPPPGRSFTALAETTSILAANISHCRSIEVRYDLPSDSYGRLIMIFDDFTSWDDSPSPRYPSDSPGSVPPDRPDTGPGPSVDGQGPVPEPALGSALGSSRHLRVVPAHPEHLGDPAPDASRPGGDAGRSPQHPVPDRGGMP